MEVSGVVSRPFPCFSGTGIDTQSSKLAFSTLPFDAGVSASGELRVVGCGGRVGSVRGRKVNGYSGFGYMDHGHLQYYVSPKAGLKKEKEKKKSEKGTEKKKLKLVKGLAKDLLTFSSMGFGVDGGDGLVAQVKEKKISEAADILLAQLQLLRAEEKETKKKRKEEKAGLKATGCESSSSESSDSDCGEVVNMNLLRNGAMSEPKVNQPQIVIPEEALTSHTVLIQEPVQVGNGLKGASCSRGSSTSESSVMVAASANKIEVCMGGKCKKLGAPALIEEFERTVGVQAAVVGCKCMGKCRDGPNVRVLNQCGVDIAEINDDSLRVHTTTSTTTTTNPLCIGVSLEDVGVIVGNFFGEGRKELGLMAAA